MTYSRTVTIYEHADAARMLIDLNPTLHIGDAQEIVRQSPAFALIMGNNGRLEKPVWTDDQIEVLSQQWRRNQPVEKLRREIASLLKAHTTHVCADVEEGLETIIFSWLDQHTITKK